MSPNRLRRPSEVVGSRVRDLRIARGWSQARLADCLQDVGINLGQSNVARLETGKRDVSLDDVYCLALALDCPPLILLAPGDDTTRVRVGRRGENASRLRAWIVGRQPLDTVRNHDAYREHVGRLREPTGFTVGPFLREIADQLDADTAEGQEQAILSALDYLKGSLRAVRQFAARYPADTTQEG
jgi:transcriptional regulator with XRE-family HTH domain